MDFQDRSQGNTDDTVAAEDASVNSAQAPSQTTARTVVLQPDANNVVTLPNGVSFDNIVADGRDLVIVADGIRYVIPEGAIIVPQLVVDGITVPPLNLAALLIGNEPVPAAGPGVQSSGGNFATDPGNIQDAYRLGDLLPYTELAFPEPREEEIIPQIDNDPELVIVTPDNPVGAINATANVDEAGLPPREGEPAGSNEAADSETTTGTITYDSPDGTDAILINGVEITGPGQTISTPNGTLTIVSVVDGEIGYTYTLNDNALGDPEPDVFTVTVIDPDGDEATGTLTINVIDDVPVARNDSDLVPAGTYGPESGNVITGTGTTTGATGADTLGADGASITSVSNADGDVATPGEGPMVIAGEYGTLTLQPGGSYTYVRNPGTEGGVSDPFTYTLTDGDGSTSTAVLTINIGDSPATVISVPGTGDPGTIVDEAGLPPRVPESPGTQEPTPVETTSGTITFAAPDGVATVTINDVVITGPGQVITTPEGTLTIVDYDPDGGTIDYDFTLGDNTIGDGTSVTFDVTVTDTDGDSDSGTFTITILNDTPDAINDFAGQVGENTPVVINAFGNDIPGADSVQFDAIATVPGSLSGTGSVVYNGDGTFTYTPGPREEGTVTFDYTITDGDGDSDTATVTITLGADSKPSITLDGGTEVDEAGLPARGDEPAGSDADSDSETTSGIIAITTGNDTLASLVINGVNVTGGGTVTTGKGVLEVTVTGGEYSYSYTLADNTLTTPDTDSFTLTVTDSDGDNAGATLVISIANDTPSALNDGADVDAGAYGPVIGNVVTNDTQGADGAVVTSYTGSGGTGGADTVVQGTYGTLTIDADGNFSYTRDPGTPGGVMDTFSYVITDGDGDTATADLIISIADSGTNLDLPVSGEAGTEVFEAGLPNGSDAAGDGEFTSGTIAFTAPDGPATVTIDGVTVTAVNQTFTGASGTLTVTGIADGVITYTYELTSPTSGDNTSDTFQVEVIDVDGDSTQGPLPLVINIVDDEPLAVNDADSITEGGPLVADGNVITGVGGTDSNDSDGVADTQGADGATVQNAGTFTGMYGTLVLGTDGSYEYVVSQEGAALLETLTDGQTLTDEFDYTLVDGDTDTSPGKLTITLNGVNDPVALNGLDAGVPNVLVNEANLPDGSDPSTPDLTKPSTFSFDAPDGVADLTIGGVSIISAGVFVPGQTIDTPSGTATVTGFTPVTAPDGTVIGGTIQVEFELTDPTAAHDATGSDVTSETLPVVVTDRDGDIATADFQIDIVDDIPDAMDDDAGQVDENEAFTIDALDNDVFGADGVDTANIASVFVATQPTYGTVTYDPATMEFTYTPNPGAGSDSLLDSFTYTIVDNDGDSDTATVNITLEPDSTPDVVSVVALSDDDGIAESNPAFDPGDIDANFGDSPLSANEAIFSGQITVDFGEDTGTVSFANLDGTTGTVGTETVDYSWDAGSNTLTATGPRGVLFTVALDPDGTFVLTQIDNVLHQTGNGELNAADVVLNYLATDSDDDTDASGTLTISFNDDVPTATADTNMIGEGATVVGNVLTDGTADVFGSDGPTGTTPAGGVIGFDSGSDINVAGTTAPGGTIETELGFLTLNADGSYSYESKSNSTNTDTTDTFVYTIADGDGDISTQTLTISINNVAADISDNEVTVDESGLDASGSQLVPDGETGNGQITVIGATGTLVYTLTDPADGAFGTLVLDPDTGSYTYTLDTAVTDTTGDDGRNTVVGPLQGAEAFNYEVRDTAGTLIGTGTITVSIVDDVPIARDEPIDLSIAEDASGPATLSGNVLTNDTPGADGASVTSVNIEGTDFAVAAAGITTIGAADGLANGTYTFDADGNWTFDPNPNLDQTAGPVDASFTYTLTDGDGDTDTATQVISVVDGAGPTAGGPVTVTLDDANLPDGSSATAPPVQDSDDIVFTPGSDDISSIKFDDSPAALDNLDPALTWVRVDDNIITGSDGGTLIVTLALTVVGNTATVTATLSDNFDAHPLAGDDTFDLGSVGVVASDIDGNSATGIVNVEISDDVPSVTGTDPAANALSVDETTLGTPSAEANLAALFDPQYYADGQAAADPITYALGVSAAGADSGLNDVATGQDVLLRVNGAGEVEGYIDDGGTGVVVFTLVVDADGLATLTQARAVEHGNTASDNEPAGLVGTDLITLTATIKDGDGDTDSAVIDLTGGLTFFDDGPAIEAVVTDNDAIELLTQDAETDGDPTDFDTATADFSGAFTTAVAGTSYGADGAGMIEWAYGLVLKVAEGTNSSLTSNGAAIYLYQAADGTVIGSTSATEVGITAGNTIFDLTVSATGSVTSTQYAELDHTDADTANYDSEQLSLPTGLIAISGTATITDRDGDTASDTVELDLGGNVIFADDGPTVTATGVVPALNVDETTLGNDDSQSFAGVFTAASGADGAASSVYALSVLSAGVDSGLVDTASGNSVFLFLEGGVVVGRQGVDAAAAATGDQVFTLTVDTLGNVELDQTRAIVHGDPMLANEPVGLASDDLISLGLTLTDGDGDTATASVAIGSDISFNDDAPSASDEAGGSLAEGATVNGQLDFLPGADGATVTAIDGTVLSFGLDGFSQTIDIGNGTIKVKADGSYEFTADNPLNNPVGSPAIADATFTVTDGDLDTDTANILFSITDANAPTGGMAAAAVDDDGLANGNPFSTIDDLPDQDLDGDGDETTFSGTLTFTPGGDVPATVGFASTVNGSTATVGLETVTYSVAGNLLTATVTGGDRDGTDLFTVEITDTQAGTYTVTLLDNVLHIGAPNEEATDATAAIAFTVTDSDLSTAAATLNITFDDDAPTATDNFASAATVGQDLNVGFILDFSGSVNNNELHAMLVATKAAALQLFDSTTGDVTITTTAFASVARSYAPITDYASFATFIDSLDPQAGGTRPYNSGTDYTAAIQSFIANFVPDADANNQVFFLSDGIPNEQTGTGALLNSVATQWQNFVTNNDLNVTSVGIGGGIQTGPLQDIDVDGVGAPILAADFNTLLDDLAAVIRALPIEGNVLTDGTPDQFGADGGRILSITIDGTTYTWDGTPANQLLDQDTAEGGNLVFNFATGEFTYTAPAPLTGDITEDFTYVLIDGDGDTATATLTVSVPFEFPTVGTDAVAVSEEGLAAGNPDAIPAGLDTTDLAVQTGTVPVSPASPSDTLTVTLLEPTDPLTSNGQPVTWSLSADGKTLVGSAAGAGTVITVVIDDAGAYTVTLTGPVDHPSAGSEDIASFSIPVRASDGTDATTEPNGITVTIEDDSPLGFSPVDLTDTTTATAITQDDALANSGSATATRLINDADNNGIGENFIGGDGFGGLVFTGGTDASQLAQSGGDPITSGGVPVYLFGFGTDTLTATTSATNTVPGAVVFTVTLDPGTGAGADATYAIEFFATLDDGAGFVFDDFSTARAGQNQWIGLDADGGNINAENNDSEDLLITGINGTVNTSSSDIGTSNQWIDAGEGTRLDFVTDVRRDGASNEKTVQGYTFDGHYDVTNSSFSILQLKGGGTASVRIRALDDPDTGGIKTLSGTTVAIDQASIVVTTSTGAVRTSGIAVTSLGDGTFVITGLNAGDNVAFDGTANFNALSITNASALAKPGGGTFGGTDYAIGKFGFQSATSGDQINLDFDVLASDADGDTSTGTINLTLTPTGITPVVLDLDGDGTEFLSLTAGVQYDYGNGLETTAWAGADDGLLARSTADGLDIVFTDDAEGARTDLEGLALAYDSNGDGKFDASDVAYGDFGVWQDADSDGVVDAGEFRSLADAGITSIDLGSDGASYLTAGGDVMVHGTGSYTKADGSTGQLADASFATAAAASIDQRSTQIASVNAMIAAVVMPELLLAADYDVAGQIRSSADFAPELMVTGSALTTMAMPQDMAMVSDDFFGHSQVEQISLSSRSIGHENHDALLASGFELGTLADHGAIHNVGSEPAFAFGSDAQVSAFVAPSVEGVQMMDALLTLGTGGADAVQMADANAAIRSTHDMPELREAFADVAHETAVDAIVSHFGGGLRGGGEGADISHIAQGAESDFNVAILNVGLADAQVSFGMHAPMEMTAEDLSALAVSA